MGKKKDDDPYDGIENVEEMWGDRLAASAKRKAEIEAAGGGDLFESPGELPTGKRGRPKKEVRVKVER